MLTVIRALMVGAVLFLSRCVPAVAQEQSLPVTLCQLQNDPAGYNHRLVEVTAFVSHAFEDFSLFDLACHSSQAIWEFREGIPEFREFREGIPGNSGTLTAIPKLPPLLASRMPIAQASFISRFCDMYHGAYAPKEMPTMNYRQKTLLGLLSAFGGHLPSTDFQKYLFLYTREFQQEPSFEFVPYRFGSFSFQSYADKRRLVELRALTDAEDWQLQEGFATDGLFDEATYSRCYAKYSKLSGTKLLQEVYRRYPYYAIKSERASTIMNDQELSAITAARPAASAACFFTIGYEGSTLEGYLNRLIRNNVKTLVDVRRNPLSRKYGFSKRTLSDTVRKLGIDYVHIPELGIASDRRQQLHTQMDYDNLFTSYEKQQLKQNGKALQYLFDLFVKEQRVAITCFEAKACMCHRGRVAKAMSTLPDWKYDISHI